MKKYKPSKIFWYVVVNGFFAFALYLAVMGNNTAENIITFFIPIMFTATFLLSLVSVEYIIEHDIEWDIRRSVPAFIDHIYDIGVLVVLAGQGWFFLGIFYIAHMLLLMAVFEKANEVKRVKGEDID